MKKSLIFFIFVIVVLASSGVVFAENNNRHSLMAQLISSRQRKIELDNFYRALDEFRTRADQVRADREAQERNLGLDISRALKRNPSFYEKLTQTCRSFSIRIEQQEKRCDAVQNNLDNCSYARRRCDTDIVEKALKECQRRLNALQQSFIKYDCG